MLNLSDWKIRCTDSSDCSPAVGALIHSAGLCTTFLIEKDVVATNAHCVPPSVKHDGDSCAGLLAVLLPDAGDYKAEQLECDHLLSISLPASRDWIKRPDFAFFKLAKATERPPLKVNHNGVADNETLTLRKVNFQAAKHMGEILRVECKAVQNSVYDPLFSADQSPVVALGSCPVIHGNSGSPMLDSSGEVRAIVSAQTVLNLNHKTGLPKFDIRGFGSNFSCINMGFLGVGYGLAKECVNILDSGDDQKARSALFKKANAQIQSQINDHLKTIFAELKKQLKTMPVEWQMQNESVEPAPNFRISYLPKCWMRPKAPSQIQVSSRFLAIDLSADDDGRLISHVEEQPYQLNYKLSSSSAKQAQYDTSIEFGAQSGDKVSVDLPVCD